MFVSADWQQRIQQTLVGSDAPAVTLTARIIDSGSTVLVSFSVLTPTVNADGSGSIATSTDTSVATGTPDKFQLLDGATVLHELSSGDINLTAGGSPITSITTGRSYSATIPYSRDTIAVEFEQDNTWRQRAMSAFFGLSLSTVPVTGRLTAGATELVAFSSLTVVSTSPDDSTITSSTGTATASGTPTQFEVREGSTTRALIPQANLTITDGQGATVTTVTSSEQYSISGSGVVLSFA